MGGVTLGVAGKLLGSSFARVGADAKLGKLIGTGAVVGGADNAVFAGLQQGFRDGNWDDRGPPGLARVTTSAVVGGALGAAIGGLGGAARSAARTSGDAGHRRPGAAAARSKL